MQGQTFDALPDFYRLSMDQTIHSVFGASSAQDAESINQSIAVLQENISFHFETPFYPGLNIPTARNRQMTKALQSFEKILFHAVQERRNARTTEADFGDDLLGLFMAAHGTDTGQGMSDQELRDEILTVFATGPEPVAIALAWTSYFLAKNPVLREKLDAELAQVLNGRVPSVADLPRLVYTRMVLQESLRLFPPAWLINRSAIGDDEISGYSIPAGGVIMMSPYLTHRHLSYWDDPEKFDPERFTPEHAAGRPTYAYFPFGFGPHQCIGMDLAMLQAQLSLPALAQRFRVELAPEAKVDIVSGLML